MSSDQTLLSRYFQHVAEVDLEGHDQSDLTAIARSAQHLASSRDGSEAAVRVCNPTKADDGWTTRHTVLQVSVDDMPFLVDSVVGELRQRDLTVHLLVHPQVVVRRGDDGVAEVLDVDVTHAPQDSSTESWMYLEIDRLPSQGHREELRDRLSVVLEDVRRACEDWMAMRRTCLDIVEELRDGVPGSVDPDTLEPTIEFLTWLEDNHFTFLGYREYDLVERDDEPALQSVPGSGLGILRNPGDEASVSALQPQAQRTATDPRLLTITKANSRSTVHRPVYLDYIGLRRFGDDGRAVAERRFLGLFTASAYAESVLRLPIIAGKVQQILDTSGFTPDSHSGKDLLGVLESYPRDELFQADVDTLSRIAHEVLHLVERRRSKLFIRPDEFGRFVSALLYIPRDRWNTAVRLRLQELLRQAYGSETVDYRTRVGESALAQLHFVVRMPRGESIPDVDVDRLQERMLEATRTWSERLSEVVEQHYDDAAAAGDLLAHYQTAFPEAYKEDFGAVAAFDDLRRLGELDADADLADLRPHLYA
ncbi:MAG: NAD-glutamate dehydrogenase, partial [Actinobacteria bacterium]|nr:NAD-glutamate dehydrogenase [Actinomycetota bacterium]